VIEMFDWLGRTAPSFNQLNLQQPTTRRPPVDNIIIINLDDQSS
jgi:hypothetical protein